MFFGSEQSLASVAGDHEILVRLHYPHRAFSAADDLSMSCVCVAIDLNAQMLQALQVSARTGAARSPMPPVNTSVGTPPNAAANAPINLRA